MKFLTDALALLGLIVLGVVAFVLLHLDMPLPEPKADIRICEQGRCNSYRVVERNNRRAAHIEPRSNREQR